VYSAFKGWCQQTISQKIILLVQHIAKMSLCYEVISSFVIFAVFYICCFSVCTQVHKIVTKYDTLIHGTYINTSGFWKRMATVLDFYFQFRFWLVQIGMSFFVCVPNFFPNRQTASRVMTSYAYFKMAAVRHFGFGIRNCRPSMKCWWLSLLVFQISSWSNL